MFLYLKCEGMTTLRVLVCYKFTGITNYSDNDVINLIALQN